MASVKNLGTGKREGGVERYRDENKLPDSPKREAFENQQEFEEALGYWQSHVGRIKAIADLQRRSKGSRPPQEDAEWAMQGKIDAALVRIGAVACSAICGEERQVFAGSYIDGPDVDLVDYASIELTDDERGRLWEATSAVRLLEECMACALVIDDAIDDAAPGMNDTFYSVWCADETALKRELANLIRQHISR